MVGALPTLHPASPFTTTPRSDASEETTVSRTVRGNLSPAQCSGENLMGSRSGR
jgi:hypothetical protein